MPISKKHKLLYVHIPKCGGTSIERMYNMMNNKHENLYGIENNLQLQHLTYDEIKNYTKINFDNFFKFSIVRNPLNRFISDYYWFKKVLNYNKSKNHFLNEVVKSVENKDYKDYKIHYRPQIDFINDELDFIGKLEQYDLIIKKLKENTNININIIHTNKTNHGTYIEELNEDEINILKKIYKKDFETFYPHLL